MTRRPYFHDEPRKVHLHHDQQGAKIAHSQRLFANTLCKMNSDVPASHITTDPDKVTCKICRKDARFKMLQNSRFGKFTSPSGATASTPLPLPRRTRYRRNWRGKLILQIEYSYNNADHRDPLDMGQTFMRWRDATLEDLDVGVV